MTRTTLERLFNAITDRQINKTWIATLEPDGGAPWKELTEALEETRQQLIAASNSPMTHDSKELPPDAEHPINYRKAFGRTKPAPDPMRIAIDAFDDISGVCQQHDKYPSFHMAEKITAKARSGILALSAPVPPPDGAAEKRR